MARTAKSDAAGTPGSSTRTTVLAQEINGSTPRRMNHGQDSNSLGYLRQRFERPSVAQKQIPVHMLGDDDSFQTKTSPTLEKLRMTPGRVYKDRQTLIQKHEEVREKMDTINVGGGVAMWPHMERMRLSRGDTIQIVTVAIALFCAVAVTFHYLHGAVISKLLFYYHRLRNHHPSHPVSMTTPETFHSSIIIWHQDYSHLLDDIHRAFDVSCVPLTYPVYILSYTLGVGTLVYYLYDSMFAKNKLSPKRIKRWVWLLTVIGTWTMGLAGLQVCAYLVETAIQTNVHQLGQVLGEALVTDLDLTTLGRMLDYWKMRCLPPTTEGMLTILGVVAVKDFMLYLQYYSLPVITVLLTPIINLIMSLFSMYSIAHR